MHHNRALYRHIHAHTKREGSITGHLFARRPDTALKQFADTNSDRADPAAYAQLG